VSGGFLYRTKGTEMRTNENSPFQVKYEVKDGTQGWWVSRSDGQGLQGPDDAALAYCYANQSLAERGADRLIVLWVNGVIN